jgi:DNA polymerase III sliding clamp (beta) subunit (PCNA family)
MSEIVDTIKRIAAFADQKADKGSMSDHWRTIQFRKGEVYAQGSAGGARAPIGLKLSCGVLAAPLLKSFRAIRGNPEFELTKRNELIVSSGDSKATLTTFPTKNSPKFHRPNGADWKPVTALDGVSRVSWAVCSDMTRPHLTGIHLGSCGIEATNGHAMARVGRTDFAHLFKVPDGILVPAHLLRDLPEAVWVAMEGNRLFVADDEAGECFRSCSLISSAFPSTSSIVDSARSKPGAEVPRAALIDCVKRAMLSGPLLTVDVRKSSLAINVTSLGLQTALFEFLDSVPLESSGIEPVRFGVNGTYFLPLIENTVSDTITLRVGGEIEPIVVEDGDYVGVVMPYRM